MSAVLDSFTQVLVLTTVAWLIVMVGTGAALAHRLGWHAGYGALSISQSNLDRVLAYVEQQEKHHRKRTYQDEFRELCRKHKIEIDERYVWD